MMSVVVRTRGGPRPLTVFVDGLLAASLLALLSVAGARADGFPQDVDRLPPEASKWTVDHDGWAHWSRAARFLTGDLADDEGFPPYTDATWNLSRTVIREAESRIARAANDAIVRHMISTVERTIPDGPEVPRSDRVHWTKVDWRGGIEETCEATFVSDAFVSFACWRHWEAMHPEADREALIFVPAGEGVREVDLDELVAGDDGRRAMLALLEDRVRRTIRDDGPGTPNGGLGQDNVPAVAESLLREAVLRPGGIQSLVLPYYGMAFDVEISLLEIGSYLRPDVAAALTRSEPFEPLLLDLDPAATLPGVPVAIRFTVTTESERPVPVPERALLIVTPENGDPFVAMAGEREEERTPVMDLDSIVGDARVQKGRPATFTAPARTHTADPEWFGDPRLAVPGTYALQLLLDDELTEEAVRGCSPGRLLDGALPRAVVSAPVTLRVEKPAGADAAAWQMVVADYHEPSSLTFAGNAYLARKLWDGHRDSIYARRMAVQIGGSPEETVAIAADMAKWCPTEACREEWTLRGAEREMDVYLKLRRAGDRRGASEAAARAMRSLSKLAAVASEPKVRGEAAGMLEDAKECVNARRCDWSALRMRRWYAAHP